MIMNVYFKNKYKEYYRLRHKVGYVPSHVVYYRLRHKVCYILRHVVYYSRRL